MVKKVIGYIRVSTIEQDTFKNEAEILRFANNSDFGKVEFVCEKISGMNSWRNRKLKLVVDQLFNNDILIVPELSRLGRSLSDVLEVINILTAKKVKIYSVKENFQINGDDMQSKVMRTMFALFAEIENDLKSARTKEGLASAKARGIKLGRKKGLGKSRLDEFRLNIESDLRLGVKKGVIAKRYKVNPATLTHWIKRHNLAKIAIEI